MKKTPKNVVVKRLMLQGYSIAEATKKAQEQEQPTKDKASFKEF